MICPPGGEAAAAQDNPEPSDCLFCDRSANVVFVVTRFWFARLDNFPAAPGHAQLVPKRHVESLFELSSDEAAEMYSLLLRTRAEVETEHGRPDGWTVGVNEGRAAGRSIDHLHIHLIPRHDGDMPDPRGGIRQCVPGWAPDAWTGGRLIPAGQVPATEPGGAERAAIEARSALIAARKTQNTAREVYEQARTADPAGPVTAHARQAWADTVQAFWMAHIALETARDQLRGLHRQGVKEVPLHG